MTVLNLFFYRDAPKEDNASYFRDVPIFRDVPYFRDVPIFRDVPYFRDATFRFIRNLKKPHVSAKKM